MLEKGIRNHNYDADNFGLGAARNVYWSILAPELCEYAVARGEAEIADGVGLPLTDETTNRLVGVATSNGVPHVVKSGVIRFASCPGRVETAYQTLT